MNEIHVSQSAVLLGSVSFVMAAAVAVIGYQFKTMISEIKSSIRELYDNRNADRQMVAQLRTDFEKLLMAHTMTHQWDGLNRRDLGGNYDGDH